MGARMQAGLPLSDRESEVARLVAEGMTNQQIASRLCLSVRTVECHLWACYRKTETGTRTRLTLWLIRQGEHPSPEMEETGLLSQRNDAAGCSTCS